MSTFEAGQVVKISVKTPVTDDGSPANDDGVDRERFWVVVVHVDPDYLWGTVNNELHYVPLDLGSVVKFHRNRVVQVDSRWNTGVTTFEAEICQACQDRLNGHTAPVCQECDTNDVA